MKIFMLIAAFFLSSPILPAFAADSNPKILIAYFSNTGTTEKMAKAIANSTGGVLFEIATTYEYPKEYDPLKVVVEKELKEQVRPELKNKVEDMASYDMVFIGFPNWMGHMPMPVYSFLEEYNLEGKTIVPFCTNKGSGFGLSLQRLKTELPKSTLAKELGLHGEKQDTWDDQLNTWLTELGVKK